MRTIQRCTVRTAHPTRALPLHLWRGIEGEASERRPHQRAQTFCTPRLFARPALTPLLPYPHAPPQPPPAHDPRSGGALAGRPRRGVLAASQPHGAAPDRGVRAVDRADAGGLARGCGEPAVHPRRQRHARHGGRGGQPRGAGGPGAGGRHRLLLGADDRDPPPLRRRGDRGGGGRGRGAVAGRDPGRPGAKRPLQGPLRHPRGHLDRRADRSRAALPPGPRGGRPRRVRRRLRHRRRALRDGRLGGRPLLHRLPEGDRPAARPGADGGGRARPRRPRGPQGLPAAALPRLALVAPRAPRLRGAQAELLRHPGHLAGDGAGCRPRRDPGGRRRGPRRGPRPRRAALRAAWAGSACAPSPARR